jgi:hypothetical protein
VSKHFKIPGCFDRNTAYFENNVNRVYSQSETECFKWCFITQGCQVWTFVADTQTCLLYNREALQNRTNIAGYISGSSKCPGVTSKFLLWVLRVDVGKTLVDCQNVDHVKMLTMSKY